MFVNLTLNYTNKKNPVLPSYFANYLLLPDYRTAVIPVIYERYL
jgi:hypothetical protein